MEYMENEQFWIKHVSPTPATKVDVVMLNDELSKRLLANKARSTGICKIREELYS